jgi:hypothetical protein
MSSTGGPGVFSFDKTEAMDSDEEKNMRATW